MNPKKPPFTGRHLPPGIMSPGEMIEKIMRAMLALDGANVQSIKTPKPARDSAGTEATGDDMNAMVKKGRTLADVGPQAISAAEVVHRGEQVVLPEGMKLEQAIDLLQRRQAYMGQQTQLVESFDAFPWDGAAALERVLVAKYGWAPQVGVPGFWADNPPTTIAAEVGLGVTKQIPWGRFSLPNVPGYVETGMAEKDGRKVFGLTAITVREYDGEVRALFDQVRAEIASNSIYRGKAVRVRFCDDDGDALDMPEIKFLDTDVDENALVYSADVDDAIRTNLFTPLERLPDCIANGIPFKRGVLLGGIFGTGKTLAAKVASKLAVQNGITFIYVPRADELAAAVAFARLYQDPAAVIFCEDVDRVMAGERSVEMDDVLNIIDGIDSKASKIMVVLTTNELERIHPAMLRPGRLDAVIEVTAPDADAVQRLLRVYGRDAIDPAEDLSEAGKVLHGQIPAVIAEVVKRAKLAQLRRQAPGDHVTRLTGVALAEAARTMASQVALLSPRAPAPAAPTLEELVHAGVKTALNGTVAQVKATHDMAEQILDHVS